ncbi:bifunctional enoyl-CoA hydratase/phosphate acetyltransferase [Clostridium sediminicola]|uniref:bifunctional enoyl-CoA hydratase/phosphate acetyltransferase n=1 Tax=Clostridium sediminicola TaxID=3114879 RepID=UPI0031F1EB66
MIKKLDGILEKAKKQMTMKLSVAAAEDEEVLMAVLSSAEMGIIEPILVGNEKKIKEICERFKFELKDYRIINECDINKVGRKAVELVSSGEADFVMKGLLDTSILLKAVLDKEIGLRTDSQLSHVMVYESQSYHKLIYLTDGGMNMYPDLNIKTKIIKNAVDVVKSMGNEIVKVACLAAKEKVNPKMPATVDADNLKKLGISGEFGKKVIVDGPMALDLAVSKEAAKIKKYESKIVGDADIFMVPNIEMGNGIGKSLTYFGGAKSAGIIMGAKAPVVLVSRADTYESKLYSIALGSVIAANKKS